ncbi:MAG TPA: photosystem I reaction center subunit XII [Synechococcus sp. UBA8638]|nr:photosystem I reaction center subunit XII [Synechococcus sp. UBA8638]
MAGARLGPGGAQTGANRAGADSTPCNRPWETLVAVPENGQDFNPCLSVDQTQVFIALVVALHAAVLAVRLSVALYRA